MHAGRPVCLQRPERAQKLQGTGHSGLRKPLQHAGLRAKPPGKLRRVRSSGMRRLISASQEDPSATPGGMGWLQEASAGGRGLVTLFQCCPGCSGESERRHLNQALEVKRKEKMSRATGTHPHLQAGFPPRWNVAAGKESSGLVSEGPATSQGNAHRTAGMRELGLHNQQPENRKQK